MCHSMFSLFITLLFSNGAVFKTMSVTKALFIDIIIAIVIMIIIQLIRLRAQK